MSYFHSLLLLLDSIIIKHQHLIKSNTNSTSWSHENDDDDDFFVKQQQQQHKQEEEECSLLQECVSCSLFFYSFYSFIEDVFVFVCLLSFSWGKINFKIYTFLSLSLFSFLPSKRGMIVVVVVVVSKRNRCDKIFKNKIESYIVFSLFLCVTR